MFGLDPKSIAVGVLVGYFVAPRIVGFVGGKLAQAKAGDK